MADELSFSSSLYSADAVKQAVAAFEHLGKFTVETADDSIRVKVENPDPDVADVLLDELANFALAQTVQGRGQG